MAKEKTFAEKKKRSALVALFFLYPVDVFVSGWFALLIFGSVAAFISADLEKSLTLQTIGYLGAGLTLLMAFSFGFGITQSEFTLHMDDKKWNDYIVIVMIVFTGLFATVLRYHHVQETKGDNIRATLAADSTYMSYKFIAERDGTSINDAWAADKMQEREEYLVKQHTGSGGAWSFMFDTTIACILAALINLCLGLMVNRYYSAERELEYLGYTSRSIDAVSDKLATGPGFTNIGAQTKRIDDLKLEAILKELNKLNNGNKSESEKESRHTHIIHETDSNEFRDHREAEKSARNYRIGKLAEIVSTKGIKREDYTVRKFADIINAEFEKEGLGTFSHTVIDDYYKEAAKRSLI